MELLLLRGEKNIKILDLQLPPKFQNHKAITFVKGVLISTHTHVHVHSYHSTPYHACTRTCTRTDVPNLKTYTSLHNRKYFG